MLEISLENLEKRKSEKMGQMKAKIQVHAHVTSD